MDRDARRVIQAMYTNAFTALMDADISDIEQRARLRNQLAELRDELHPKPAQQLPTQHEEANRGDRLFGEAIRAVIDERLHRDE